MIDYNSFKAYANRTMFIVDECVSSTMELTRTPETFEKKLKKAIYEVGLKDENVQQIMHIRQGSGLISFARDNAGDFLVDQEFWQRYTTLIYSAAVALQRAWNAQWISGLMEGDTSTYEQRTYPELYLMARMYTDPEKIFGNKAIEQSSA